MEETWREFCVAWLAPLYSEGKNWTHAKIHCLRVPLKIHRQETQTLSPGKLRNICLVSPWALSLSVICLVVLPEDGAQCAHLFDRGGDQVRINS